MTYVVFLVLWLCLNIAMAALHRSEKFFLVVNGIFLVLIAGLRGIHIGRDVENYGRLFATYGRMSLQGLFAMRNNVSPGYVLLAKLVYILTGGNYQIMLFVCAAIIIYGIFKFAYCYSPNAVASVFYFVTLFYYFEGFNVVRQWVAVSIVLLGLIALDEHRYYKFLVFSVSAILVHNSAIITFIPYLVFRKISWNKALFGIYSAVLIIGMSAFPILIRLFIRIFPQYSSYTFILEGGFLGEGFGGETRGRRTVLSISFLLALVFALVLISEKLLSPEAGFANKPGMKNMFWLSAAMVMAEIVIGCFFPRNSFYVRIQSFFSVFSIILLPTIFERLTKKWRLLVYIVTNMGFLAATAIKLVQSSGMYPYQFFWQ